MITPDTDSEVPPSTPAERLRQALDLMAVGLRVKRLQLRSRFPADTDEEHEGRYLAWVLSDDR